MPSYGQIDAEYATHLVTCPPEQDGPILMVNFMRYRARADYGAEGDRGMSGQEADDRYAPLAVLAEIGAEVVFFGDIDGASEWHRVGIVRYPSRREFMAMQSRPDFQALHVHKIAGMERTIVCGTLPAAPLDAAPAGDGRVLFELVAADTPLAQPPTARLRVEGVIVGDGRRFATLGVTWLRAGDAVPAPGAGRVAAAARPSIDQLAAQFRRADLLAPGQTAS